MKTLWHVVIFFVVCVVLGLGIAYAVANGGIRFPTKSDTAPLVQIPTVKKPIYQPITLTFVGDIMMDRGVENSVHRNFNGDFNAFLSFAKTFLSTADIAFANLEGPVGINGPNVGSAYSFQMDPAVLPALQDAGLDIVSFANNHVGDRSTTGFNETLENLQKNNILFTGAGTTKPQAVQPTIITVRDKKIGFLGFTDVGPDWLSAKESSPGILLLSDPNLETIITTAKSQVDVLIIAVHWGAEYKPATTRQKTFAHTMINWGADAIIGAHPHVIQATEWYDGKFIAYSLGNFIFDQYFSDDTMQGLVINMNILENNQVTVTQQIVELSRQYQPTSLREATASDYITAGTVSSQACPPNKDATIDLWLSPVGHDLDIGNYIPKTMVPMNNRVDARGTATCLVQKSADAVIAMFHAMEDLGMKPVMTSGFRTRSVQADLYNSSPDTQMAATDPTLYPSVALPGHSEHQLGTAIDIKSGTSDDFSYTGFKNSDEYTWLVKYAADYGFINSYQEGTEPITGYIAEPWHWRYVGVENAKKIQNQGVTTYEYLKSI